MNTVRFVALTATASTLMLAAGCRNPDTLLPPPIVPTPLALDPMDEWSVDRWWSNGEQLIRFDETGAYTLFPTMNRYHDPVQLGRWVKDSYARVMLEPYQAHRMERIRVGVDRLDGRIAMMLPDRAPFFAIEGPPIMPEDGLLGSWSGERNELRLTGDRRFRLVHRMSNDGDPLLLKGNEGRWTLRGSELVLVPQAIGIDPITLSVHADDDGPVLRLGDEQLNRQ